MIDNIFEAELGDRSIFRDTFILSPHYVPQELPHREAEIRKVTRIMAPALRDEKPCNVFIYGKTGTGKTCVMKYVVRKLNEFVDNPVKNVNGVVVRVVYINCKVRDTKYQVLLKTLEAESLNNGGLKSIPLGDREDNHLKGMDPGDLYDRLFRVVEDNGMNLVVVLDEVDMVRKGLNDLVYMLTRINDELRRGHVSVAGMSNDMKVKRRLDPRSRSTLCEEEMVFRHYNAVQLKTILRQRVDDGFQEGVIGNACISKIAAFAAQDGDARYALKLLQMAGEIARDSGGSRILDEHVDEAKRRVEVDIIAEAIGSLPEHQQIVLYSIACLVSRGGMYRRLSGFGGGDLFTGEVYEAYEDNCGVLSRKPRTTRQFSEYLNELDMLGLITVRMSGKGQRGTTRFIRLGYPPNEVKDIVMGGLGLTG